MRAAFATAAQRGPEILLLDEVVIGLVKRSGISVIWFSSTCHL